jgi:hypothetical protein
MSSLVFVHGIGVRAPTDGKEHPLNATCRAIGWELFSKKIDWKVVKCNWGDAFGAHLQADGKSLPRPHERLGVTVLPDDPAGLWETLLDDPTFELRALAAMQAAAPGIAPGGQPLGRPGGPPGGGPGGPPGSGRPAWVDLRQRLAAGIAPMGALEERLKRFDLQACFARALSQVQADPSVNDALLHHPRASTAIARAIVARTVRIALEEGLPPPGLAETEAITSDTDQLLRQAQLGGLFDWGKSVLLGWGTSWGERRRATVAAQATPLAGDIIIYQAHGEQIRGRIREVVAGAPEPVAVLAHSLGGVATTEALCEFPEMRQRVKRFITAGSQPGYFYEINGLRRLPFGQPLPEDFPDWLNFWDPRDFLSFLIAPVFNGGRERTDVEVDSGLPFPASHSGYWRQPVTWEKIKTFLAS